MIKYPKIYKFASARHAVYLQVLMGCIYKTTTITTTRVWGLLNMCRRDGRARERARQIGKPSVGRVGTTLGDVYQGRVWWRWIRRTVSITAHTRTRTHARRRQLTVGENKLLCEPRGTRRAGIARSSETLLAVYDKKKKEKNHRYLPLLIYLYNNI